MSKRRRKSNPAQAEEAIASADKTASALALDDLGAGAEFDCESDAERSFFSQRPVAEEELSNPNVELSLPTEPERWGWVIARRARFRRRVAVALTLGASLIASGAWFRRYSEPRTVPPLLAQAAPRLQVTLSAAVAKPVAVATASASASAAPIESAQATSAGLVVSVHPPDAGALLASASRFLGAGHSREGVAAARSAVAVDPLDARGYVLLAAGLEDLGNWPQARAAFADCRKRARHGPRSACAYFARH